MSLKRLLLSNGARCPFGCRYCFASFSQFPPPISLSDLEKNPKLLSDCSVLYPSCDSDLFARPGGVEVLARAVDFGVSISVSTKAEIDDASILAIISLADRLKIKGHILKIGVSFSTKHSISKIEPRTSSYETRLETLRKLSIAGIPSCAILKPIIVEISPEEYSEIVQDVSEFADAVVLGAEYLDHNLLSGACLDRPGLTVSYRTVKWLSHSPVWACSTVAPHIEDIIRSCVACGIDWYESDLDFMESLLSEANRAAFCVT
jgi:DNA repair photolyase